MEMDSEILNKIVDKYFECFELKDIQNLRDMVCPDIYLKDWEINSIGIDNFVINTKVIFDSIEQIKINRISTDFSHNKIFCIIELILDDNISKTVLDVIEVDNNFKIRSIQAFRQ